MELWIPYALMAAFLIACRDVFTKQYSQKYRLTSSSVVLLCIMWVFRGSICTLSTLLQRRKR